MKIHQLPMGARFEYEGQEYVKTGPQIGAGKTGQRLIPKYAVLTVAGEGAPKPAPPPPLSREGVVAAFDLYHARCAALVPAEKRGELEAARADFLQALG
jgi:hypothetical protein